MGEYSLGLSEVNKLNSKLLAYYVGGRSDLPSSGVNRLLKNALSDRSKRSQLQGARKIDEWRRTYAVRWSEAVERNDRLCENETSLCHALGQMLVTIASILFCRYELS
jgi:hypothetical protein